MAESGLLDKWRNISLQKKIPLQASIELTNTCNERCRHCYIPSFKDDPKRTLNQEQWFEVLDQLREAGVLYLILMGGEPLLSPHFWAIAERGTKLGFHVSIITNGLLIKTSEEAARLKAAGIQNVTVSLYSLYPETHDYLTRVKGSCEKTKRAVELCVEQGIDVSINCLLMSKNIDSVFELEQWCLDLGIRLKVDPQITAKLDGDLEPIQLRPSEEQLRWFYNERTRRWPKSRPKIGPESPDGFVCNAAKGKCAITAYGELLPCIEIREPMGTLTTHSFDELWNSPEADKWRGLKNKDLDGFIYNGQCEHCPGMAKNENGDALKVNRFAQILAEIKQQVGEGGSCSSL